jgi:mono/diheme cytochrome c family protein
MMNNDQVAAVVNYVRTHFGNNYPDEVTSEEIQAMRR